ncbi:MAG: hypothetical protein WA708_10255 [Acidobacteriaceae bacterium]
MQLLLRIMVDVLVGMFVAGGVVSTFVIIISFVEDMHELLSKND